MSNSNSGVGFGTIVGEPGLIELTVLAVPGCGMCGHYFESGERVILAESGKRASCASHAESRPLKARERTYCRANLREIA